MQRHAHHGARTIALVLNHEHDDDHAADEDKVDENDDDKDGDAKD